MKSVTTWAQSAVRYLRNQPWYYTLGGGIILVAVLAIGVNALTRSEAAAPLSDQPPHVKIASVASLSSQGTGPLPVTGTVTSRNHASILAQSSGEVVSLSRSIGDYVAAGSIIGQLENSSQRAAVLQARGAYAAAQATYESTSGTSAANSSISATQATQAVANAQASLNTSLQNVYAALDNAIHARADILFSQPNSNNPTLRFSAPNSQTIITVQNERVQLNPAIAEVKAIAAKTTRTDVSADTARTGVQAQLAITFLNHLAEVTNQGISNPSVSAADISAYQISIAAARSEVTTALSGLVSAKAAYDSALASAASASNTAQGGTQGSISVAKANVEQAQGTLAVAQAALEKTIIRAPISGTIVSLPISQGEYVSMGQQMVEISNPSALEVEVYVTPSDARTLAVGGAAQIAGAVQGSIVSIAPAIDPTIGKVPVKIGIVGDQSVLTNGETVSVSLSRANTSQTKTQTPKTITASSTIVIPVVAAKITPSGPVVFTVSASSTLVQTPITFGTILGDRVMVLSGLSPEMIIVEDARGLSNGQKVTVSQ